MKTQVYIFAALLASSLFFSSCTHNGTATEQSDQMGAANAEGGSTPYVSDMQDSLAKNRAGGAEQNAGVSHSLNTNSNATPGK